nr:mannitol dehydrogenase family protein [Altericroceibacterium indicum]
MSSERLAQVSAGSRFSYNRTQQAIGIVHFGIGAFHRAHQAWYTDRAMDAGDRNWATCGVSLRSKNVADQLTPQDGLYTVAERSERGTHLCVVGAVQEVLVHPRDCNAIIERLSSPDTHIASFTVTEKGYCRSADGSLDPDRAGAGSIYDYLTRGLALRKERGLSGLTLLSCDNLADNGRQLERLLKAYCAENDAQLGEWIATNCTFPCTMVDRIVPATTDADRTDIMEILQVQDEAAVVTESFTQWVIEDKFAGPRPAWEQVGAEIVSDVAPYETAKLRMLNGAHSALAYLGLKAGYTFVHEAIGDPALRSLVEQLMREEAAPTVATADGQSLPSYAEALIARFANPALQHKLIQIGMDGSQKIPQRWLETLEANRTAGRQCPAIIAAMKAWFAHLRGDNGPVEDPMADRLTEIASRTSDAQCAVALFGEGGMMPRIWQVSEEKLQALFS